jgi:hypothetical protein
MGNGGTGSGSRFFLATNHLAGIGRLKTAGSGLPVKIVVLDGTVRSDGRRVVVGMWTMVGFIQAASAMAISDCRAS